MSYRLKNDRSRIPPLSELLREFVVSDEISAIRAGPR